jgi:hypothetical protein
LVNLHTIESCLSFSLTFCCFSTPLPPPLDHLRWSSRSMEACLR